MPFKFLLAILSLNIVVVFADDKPQNLINMSLSGRAVYHGKKDAQGVYQPVKDLNGNQLFCSPSTGTTRASEAFERRINRPIEFLNRNAAVLRDSFKKDLDFLRSADAKKVVIADNLYSTREEIRRSTDIRQLDSGESFILLKLTNGEVKLVVRAPVLFRQSSSRQQHFLVYSLRTSDTSDIPAGGYAIESVEVRIGNWDGFELLTGIFSEFNFGGYDFDVYANKWALSTDEKYDFPNQKNRFVIQGNLTRDDGTFNSEFPTKIGTPEFYLLEGKYLPFMQVFHGITRQLLSCK